MPPTTVNVLITCSRPSLKWSNFSHFLRFSCANVLFVLNPCVPSGRNNSFLGVEQCRSPNGEHLSAPSHQAHNRSRQERGSRRASNHGGERGQRRRPGRRLPATRAPDRDRGRGLRARRGAPGRAPRAAGGRPVRGAGGERAVLRRVQGRRPGGDAQGLGQGARATTSTWCTRRRGGSPGTRW
jgi:hypothetical protein